MKKRILKVLVVTIIAICSFSLVACNSENDKSGGLKKRLPPRRQFTT